MKKSLLLIAAFFVAASAMAQDVYVTTQLTEGSNKSAAIYKNGNYYHSDDGADDGSFTKSSSAVIVDPNTGDVYWTSNCIQNGEHTWGDVYKNTSRYLSNSGSNKMELHGLGFDTGGSLLSFGYRTVNGVKVAVIYRNNNTEPYLTLGDGNYNSEVFAGKQWKLDYATNTFSCGYQKNSSGVKQAVVWEADDVKYTLGEGVARDIAFYFDNIYTLVVQDDQLSGNVYVYKNNTLLYTLSGNGDGHAWNISVEGGDVYVSGWDSQYKRIVWRNGERYYYSQTTGTVWGTMDVNPTGIYVAERGNKVFKDNNLLFELPTGCYSTGIAVDTRCDNTQAFDLPFFDGFETGETDWDCWKKIDVDGYTRFGYSTWFRRSDITFISGTLHAYEGNNFACHGWHGSKNQIGWLITPNLHLHNNHTATLTFMNSRQSSTDQASVWISTTNNDTTSFTKLADITGDTYTWLEKSIDLSSYKGQNIYIAFRYEALNGTAWYIDNVSVTETLDGIEEDGENVALSVMPNPANDVIRVNGLNGTEEVNIYNTLGQVVKSARLSDGQSLNISDLSAGVYMLRSEKSTQVVKFTVK